MEKACVQLIVSGKVQGVGFRYSAQQVANQHQLTGWVQNKINGDVEIIAEGEQHQLDLFIDWSKQGPRFANVKQVTTKKLTANNTFTHFSIR